MAYTPVPYEPKLKILPVYDVVRPYSNPLSVTVPLPMEVILPYMLTTVESKMMAGMTETIGRAPEEAVGVAVDV